MVRGEIEIARHHAAVNARPRILPVRVASMDHSPIR